MTEEESSGQYIPGSCNIGREEIRRRNRIGWTGLFLSLVTALILHLLQAAPLWKLVIFIPVFYSVSGFVQAAFKFCYVYGYWQIFSTKGIRNFTKVKQEGSIKKDRTKAVKIVVIVTITSILITSIYYFIS